MKPSPELTHFCVTEYPRLVGMLSLYCGGKDLAEELAQEALMRVCLHWANVQRKDSPSAWVHRVATNLANSHFRRLIVARRARPRLVATERARALPDVTSDMTIRAAVLSLPRREREALVLRYFGDFSVCEVANSMRCPESTVKTLTRRAIERLRGSGLVSDEEIELQEVSDAE